MWAGDVRLWRRECSLLAMPVIHRITIACTVSCQMYCRSITESFGTTLRELRCRLTCTLTPDLFRKDSGQDRIARISALAEPDWLTGECEGLANPASSQVLPYTLTAHGVCLRHVCSQGIRLACSIRYRLIMTGLACGVQDMKERTDKLIARRVGIEHSTVIVKDHVLETLGPKTPRCWRAAK
jgi:hypothetical protein